MMIYFDIVQFGMVMGVLELLAIWKQSKDVNVDVSSWRLVLACSE